MAPVRGRAGSKVTADDSLRAHLRAATMAARDLLHNAKHAASGWQTCPDHARLPALQPAVRLLLESGLVAQQSHVPECAAEGLLA